MALETGTYISDLVATNPPGADDRSTADDHLRLIKSTIKASFPNISGAMTASHGDLNILVGKTLTSTDDKIDNLPATTLTVFQQSSAPTGWTKITTHNDKSFRVVSGAAGSGGSVAFTTAFASKSVVGSISGTALSIAQMPAHTHTHAPGNGSYSSAASAFMPSPPSGSAAHVSSSTGSGSTHTHTFTGTAIDMAVQYVDLILASKD